MIFKEVYLFFWNWIDQIKCVQFLERLDGQSLAKSIMLGLTVGTKKNFKEIADDRKHRDDFLIRQSKITTQPGDE